MSTENSIIEDVVDVSQEESSSQNNSAATNNSQNYNTGYTKNVYKNHSPRISEKLIFHTISMFRELLGKEVTKKYAINFLRKNIIADPSREMTPEETKAAFLNVTMKIGSVCENIEQPIKEKIFKNQKMYEVLDEAFQSSFEDHEVREMLKAQFLNGMKDGIKRSMNITSNTSSKFVEPQESSKDNIEKEMIVVEKEEKEKSSSSDDSFLSNIINSDITKTVVTGAIIGGGVWAAFEGYKYFFSNDSEEKAELISSAIDCTKSVFGL